MRATALSILVGIILVALGAMVLAGWFLQDSHLIRAYLHYEAVPASTACGFVLTGLGLLAGVLRTRHERAGAAPSNPWRVELPRWLLPSFSVALILLGVLALIEWIFNISLGLSPDPNNLNNWFVDTISYPGRMRPLAAIGFIELGLACYLLSRNTTQWALHLTPILTVSVICIGFIGIIGPLTGVGGIIPSFLGPVFVAGIGFVLSGIGLLLIQSGSMPFHQARPRDESQRITLIVTAILAVTGMVGLLGGFGVLYRQMVEELESNLELSLKYRRDALQTAIQEGLRDSAYITNHLSSRNEAGRQSGTVHDDSAKLLERIRVSLDLSREFAFTAARFRANDGRIAVQQGVFASDNGFKIPLATAIPAELIWSEGFVLRLVRPVWAEEKLLGTIEAERPLPMDVQHRDLSLFGSSLDFPVCAAQGSRLQCFPFRSTGGKVLRDQPWSLHGVPISLTYGVEGKTGVVHTTDYRGVQVIAAYGPVGSLGLVANLEVDSIEFYQRITRRLWPLLAVMFLIAITAVILLRQEVVPLVRRMTSEIEERKRTEARLKESESRLAEITTTLGEGVYVFDGQGIVTFMNPEAERILGWSAAEVLGRWVFDLLQLYTTDCIPSSLEKSPMHHAMATGKPHRASDELLMHKDGGLIPVSIVASPIVRNGIITGCVTSFEDITPIKRVESELCHYRNHLELLVEERTRELQKLNGELESFSYSVSHDLRAPLRAINGFSNVLREDFGCYLPSSAHLYLDRMSSATLRMGELIEGLLTLSRVVRSKLSYSHVDLSRMALDIAVSLKESEPQRNVTISIQDGLVVTGDTILMQTMLENIFSNAWKYTAKRPNGHIEFCMASEQAGIFCVRDNGSGFEMQFAETIFQPFQRLHSQDDFSGNGIGLATVKRIVERHGGRVWAESSPGLGTTIYFSLVMESDDGRDRYSCS